MRNDYGNRPRAKKAEGGRIGKQFGGGLSRPLGAAGVGAAGVGAAGVGAAGVGAAGVGAAGVGAPIRPRGFKHGKSAKK
jgi:hypothetical protein